MSAFKDRLNTNDPLTKPQAAPDGGRELFSRMSHTCGGFSHDDVTSAAANILINSLRQQCGSRQKAEVEFNELFGRLKSALLQHYDGAGNRRSVFPFDQTVVVPRLTMKGPGAGWPVN